MDWPTLIGAAIIGTLLLAVLARLLINKKRGKSSCSCSCGSSCSACPMSGKCHGE